MVGTYLSSPFYHYRVIQRHQEMKYCVYGKKGSSETAAAILTAEMI